MWGKLRSVSLTQWILIAMVVGIGIGWAFPEFAVNLKPLSNVFLRLIKSLIVPLLFSTLVVGIAGHGDDLKAVGRLALKAFIYFEVVTTIALGVGLGAANLIGPGRGVTLPQSAEAEQVGRDFAGHQATLAGVLEHTFPQSFFEAAAHNEVLQIVVFAMFFAIALAKVKGRHKQVMLDFCESLSQVMFQFTSLVMMFAPIGIGAAIAVTVGSSGLGVLKNLALLVGTLYGALAVFILCVLVPIAWFARISIPRFVRAVKEPALIAFTTASSEAALPLVMERMVAFGVPRRIVAFVIPTGYSFNLDGSTLYLAVAAVFAAQAGGLELPIGQQLLIMLTLMLTSKGVAAVPRASLVILSGTLATFKMPLEAVGLILGVDALMDMARTSVNLVGNSLATAVMARWEGELKEPGEVEADVAEAEPVGGH